MRLSAGRRGNEGEQVDRSERREIGGEQVERRRGNEGEILVRLSANKPVRCQLTNQSDFQQIYQSDRKTPIVLL